MRQSDERTDTNINSLGAELPPPARQHPLPWVLFGVTLVVLAIVGGMLAKKVRDTAAERNKTVDELQKQVQTLKEQQGDGPKKLEEAEARAKAAEDAKAELEQKVKKLEEAAAKTPAGGTATADATPPASDTTTKKDPTPTKSKTKTKTKKKKH